MLDRETIAQGRRRLKQLLPVCRAEAKRNSKDAGMIMNPLGERVSQYLTETNFDALVVYPAKLGGWHAELLLKRVPPGIPNAMGTPSDSPARTQAEAEERGKEILVAMLHAAQANEGEAETRAEKPPVFLLYEWVFDLNPDILAQGVLEPDEGNAGRALAMIEEELSDLAPDGFEGGAFPSWGAEDQFRLLMALHIAAVAGVFRYPPHVAASPSGHVEGGRA